MNAVNGTKIRVAKYLAPVLILSILFNVPKFFEAQIEYVAAERRTNGSSSVSVIIFLKEMSW